MADNYLEKRMEEHRRGARKIFHGPKDTKAVFVVDGVRRADEVLRLRAEPGTAVAFSGADAKAGARLAQKCGARFYCVSDAESLGRAIADAAKHWADLPFEVSKNEA